MRLRFRNWTEGLQLDWCISRQRYFGVPFPVWYPLREDGTTDHARAILADEKSLPVDPVTDVPPGYEEKQRDRPGGFTAEPDIFDTWFTSSLTPQIATGWIDKPERHGELFPMDLRPQSHEIIRTWAFYTIAKALLHEQTIPWRRVAISGWVLDPDRKKMSKSKGNVVTPMHLLDQYGADAARYWSLSARLGTDTAFDEKVLKVGRRLVTKVFNASKFVLSQSADEGPIVRALDASFLARLRETVLKATAFLEELDYAGALDAIERFFWSGFTDTYLEMVKMRAGSESDREGRASAVAALQLALKVQLRLLAPYLPYVTEEAWSWAFAESEGAPSIHRSAWPTAADFAGIAAMEDGGEAFDVACAFLEAVRRGKSAAGGTVGRHLKTLRVAASPASVRLITPCLGDLAAAARAEGDVLEAREGLDDGHFEIVELELAEPRPRS
jgi:valyl-tRNA synthetase